MARGQRYTPEEDEFIEGHWRTATDREMADQLHRTELGITSRRMTLGLKRAEKGTKDPGMRGWSKQDDRILAERFHAGCSDEEIASVLQRTRGAVGQRRSTLNLLRRAPSEGQSTRNWSKEEDEALCRAYAKGWRDEKIGRFMGKTACAIKDRRPSLGLTRAPQEPA